MNQLTLNCEKGERHGAAVIDFGCSDTAAALIDLLRERPAGLPLSVACVSLRLSATRLKQLVIDLNAANTRFLDAQDLPVSHLIVWSDHKTLVLNSGVLKYEG